MTGCTPADRYTCSCGRSFVVPSLLADHVRKAAASDRMSA